MRRLLAVGALLALFGARLPAQGGLQVHHVIIGQGELYWEKYGHNMLWFSDPATGVDIAYNWGQFDFASPDFLRRVLAGDPQYWVEGFSGPAIIEAYRRMDRTVTLQRLNLTPAQAQRAFEYAQRNALPQNRYYRYDYFLDNCSTRVRDVIDHAVEGALKQATNGTRVRLTYRGETLRLLDEMKLTQLGVHFALGRPADRRLTIWEGMFIPMRMRDAFRLVRVPGPGGTEVPLVAQERVVYESPRHADRRDTPALWPAYLIVGLLLGAELIAVAGFSPRSRVVDVIFRAEVGLYAFITGAIGLVLLLAWMTTRHEFWFRNENLLLVNPLSLFLALVVVLSIWKAKYTRAAASIAMVTAGLAVVALALKLTPGFTQNNLALILLLLPAHVAIAIGLWRRVRKGTGAGAVDPLAP